MLPKTVTDCYHIALDEATRYRGMITIQTSGINRLKYLAKHDAAMRIARLIKLGTSEAR